MFERLEGDLKRCKGIERDPKGFKGTKRDVRDLN